MRRGLRGNAVALVIGGALLLGLVALPNLTPPAPAAPPVDLARGRIVSITAATSDPSVPNVVVDVIDGPLAGHRLEAFLQGPGGQAGLPEYAVGDEVVVSLSAGQEGSYAAVSDRFRAPLFVLILALFAIGVTVVGGWRGLRSLLALALTLAVVAKVVVPLLLSGWNPVLLAVAAGTLVTLATILLTEGLRLTSLAAVAGTFVALAFTAVLAWLVSGLAGFTKYQGEEAAVFLQSMGRTDLDISGLLLAAVIFGALGVLDDVTVTQAATVHELADADPVASRRVLFARAMNVGRSHIAATVNTLVLAYLGASLPLLVLFALGGADPVLVASGEVVAVEVVRAVVGSIGIVAAVPLTTGIAVVAVAWGRQRSAEAELRRLRAATHRVRR